MNSTLVGPTIISPVVTRFFWPPEIPRCIWSPTMVSAHMSSPSILRV
uniref:Similar to PDR8/PEN3 (PLEIOTROPIC DRUG RESISTANCE8) n=1 Tax=Arundo donax TaxID=35708 RepID=A0A0A9CWS2_ARUDO